MIYQQYEILTKEDVTANWETGKETGKFKIIMSMVSHN
jgi:hypothetical protein